MPETSLADYIRQEKRLTWRSILKRAIVFCIFLVALAVFDKLGFVFYTFFAVIVAVLVFDWHQSFKKLNFNISKIACPKCESYIELDSWDCPCGRKISNVHIFKGCPHCGTKYGEGAKNIRSLFCSACGQQLNFFRPYEFHNWSILAKDENTQEFKLVPRENFLEMLGDTFFLGLIFVGLIVFFEMGDPRTFSQGQRIRILIAVLILGGGVYFLPWLAKKIYPPKQLVRNPKYKEDRHG